RSWRSIIRASRLIPSSRWHRLSRYACPKACRARWHRPSRAAAVSYRGTMTRPLRRVSSLVLRRSRSYSRATIWKLNWRTIYGGTT
ncbi:hypothetical protein FOZ62_017044, partial [Perkinsus olseni]